LFKFGRSMPKGIGTWDTQKIRAHWAQPNGTAVPYPLQTRPSGCWSNGTSVLMDICWKTWFPHVPPFEVTQDHRN